MSNVHKNLVFLERQYNTVKGLIPIVNTCVSEASSPHTMAKKLFREHSAFWDVVQSPTEREFWELELPEKEEAHLQEGMLQVLDVLVRIKRLSHEASTSQKSNKLSLFELLLRLRDQVMKTYPSEILPAFTNPSHNIPTPRKEGKGKRSLRRKKHVKGNSLTYWWRISIKSTCTLILRI